MFLQGTVKEVLDMKLNVLRIKLFLGQRGWTQGKLAERAGISRQTLCAILARGSASPRSAVRLADALGVPLEQIAEVRP